ncbi:MAG: hypothetical protein V1874_17345 [Spirochaetota bacterium]
MKKIDKTKQNIGISKLDEQTRKKLYNDFVEAGGEVIDEKEKRGFTDFNRDMQKKFKEQSDQSRKQIKTQQDNSDYNYTAYKSLKNTPDIKVKYNLPKTSPNSEISRFRLSIQRFIIRMRLFLMNVTDFTGYYFTVKFFEKYDYDYKSSLLYMQTTYLNLFKQNLRNGQKIIDYLDNMHPIYFELIELLSNVFDRTTTNEILEHYNNFPDVPQEINELREPFIRIFKKLHPLSPYKEIILTGIEKALSLQSRMENIKASYYSANRKKIKNSVYIIFEKFYKRLFWLMCHYERRVFLSDKDIENTFSISAEDSPGRRKRNASKSFELSFNYDAAFNDIKATDDEEKAEDIENISNHVKSGLDFMNKIDMDKSYEISGKNRTFKVVNKNDKIFITNILFDEFDKEFSFILTTNKIKYNAISKSSGDMDYKSKFVSIYNEIGKCKNRIQDYASTLAAFEKLKREKPISNSQFIEYSNRLSALEKERNQTGDNTRIYISAFFEKLCRELKILIEDMERANSIIINPDDIIIFETAIEGDKKLNAKNVREILNITYDYATAFIYRLNPGGDLSGSINFVEDNEKQVNTNISKENKRNNEKNQKEAKTKESILKELDDLL